jgi:hypothetical protein
LESQNKNIKKILTNTNKNQLNNLSIIDNSHYPAYPVFLKSMHNIKKKQGSQDGQDKKRFKLESNTSFSQPHLYLF